MINRYDSKVTLSVEGILIVYEFSNIFSDNLLGLPPRREIKFSNELALETIPISKALYYMALAKL